MKQIGILTDNFEIVDELISNIGLYIESQGYKFVRNKEKLWCSEAEIEVRWIRPVAYSRGYFLDKVFVDRNLEDLDLERVDKVAVEIVIDRAKEVEYI